MACRVRNTFLAYGEATETVMERSKAMLDLLKRGQTAPNRLVRDESFDREENEASDEDPFGDVQPQIYHQATVDMFERANNWADWSQITGNPDSDDEYGALNPVTPPNEPAPPNFGFGVDDVADGGYSSQMPHTPVTDVIVPEVSDGAVVMPIGLDGSMVMFVPVPVPVGVLPCEALPSHYITEEVVEHPIQAWRWTGPTQEFVEQPVAQPVTPSPPAGAAPRVVKQLPAPSAITRAASVSDTTKHRIHWTADARKLKTNDQQLVSPSFDLCFGPQDLSVPFHLMIIPTVTSHSKGGAGFKKSKGKGSLQLRCGVRCQQGAPVLWRIGVGPDRVMRNPVIYDFSGQLVSRLNKEEEEWDFNAYLDPGGKRFSVCLEIQPWLASGSHA